MLKNLKNYFIIAALLSGGHFLLVEFLPNQFLLSHALITQIYLFVIFVVCDVLIRFFTEYLNIILGQAFLAFSTVKLLLSGVYILVLQRALDMNLNNWFVLVFMISYFTYLSAEVLIFLKQLKQQE